MTYAEWGQLAAGFISVLLLGLAGFGLANLRYRVPGTAYFSALCLAAFFWPAGYIFELNQSVVSGFFVATCVEYIGLALIAPLWWLVVLSWIEHPLAKSRSFRGTIFLLSALCLVLVWTNELHHWWYAMIVPVGPVGFARFTPGPLYFVFVSLFCFSFIMSTWMVLQRRRLTALFRRKAPIILTANCFPVVFALVYQLGIRPEGLDLTIFSLVPSFAVLAWGLFRHELIRVVPIARDIVFDSLDSAVVVMDLEGRLVDHNPAAKPFLTVFLSTAHPSSPPEGEFSFEDGKESRSFRYRKSPIIGSSMIARGTVLIFHEITEQRRLLHELEHQATHDALTGIANRRHFEDQALLEIARATRQGGTLALVMFDLDEFKSINDRFGHPAGDRVLHAIVAMVTPRLRAYDLLARIGGEEFAVLMPQAQGAEAREAAERWRKALETSPQVFPGAVVPVTASFGVATLNDLPPQRSVTPRIQLDALMGLADKALYQAKAEGRNRVC